VYTEEGILWSRAMAMEEDVPTCRICLGSQDDEESDAEECEWEPLIAPCACRGTTRFAHRSCILQAFRARGQWLDLACPTCQKLYVGRLGVEVAQCAMDAMECRCGTECGSAGEAPVAGRDRRWQSQDAARQVRDTCGLAVASTNLAWACAIAGEDKEALKHVLRAQGLQEKVLGPENLEVARTLDVLARVRYNLGEGHLCRDVLEQALAIKEKVLGPHHLEVANTLAGLGDALIQLGDAPRGNDLLKRAVAIKEKELGPQHLEVAYTMADLGAAYLQLGQPDKGKDLLEKALQIEERELGPEHLDVAYALADLGSAHVKLGDATRGRDLILRAIIIEERELGPGHLNVAYALADLGTAYLNLGDLANSKQALERALSIEERELGPDHLNVAYTLAVLGITNMKVDSAAQGEGMLERAVVIQERELGSKHACVEELRCALAQCRPEARPEDHHNEGAVRSQAVASRGGA
jgi:tetratricopeptide (TPR) repeat protein